MMSWWVLGLKNKQQSLLSENTNQYFTSWSQGWCTCDLLLRFHLQYGRKYEVSIVFHISHSHLSPHHQQQKSLYEIQGTSMKKNDSNTIALGWLNHNSSTICRSPRGLFSINLIPNTGTIFQMQSLLKEESYMFLFITSVL